MSLIIPDEGVWEYDDRLERIAALRALHPRAYACLDPSVHSELEAYLAVKAGAARHVAAEVEQGPLDRD